MINGKNHIFRDHLYIYLLIFPIISRWLFLDTWETALTVSVFQYPLFLPELSFLLLPFFYSSRLKRNHYLIWLAVFGLFNVLFSTVINPIQTPYLNFIGGSDFYLTTLIVALFPITQRHIKIIRWPFFAALVLLGLQIILFSLGILKYPGLEDRHQFGEILRISTTAGAATGTAIVIFMLSAVAYYCFTGRKYYQIFILGFSTTVIAFTLSRGAILAQALFLLYLLYAQLKPFSPKKLSQLVGVSIILIGAVYLINRQTGFIESLNQRFSNSEQSGDISSGRFERWAGSYQLFLQNPVFGNGSCYMNPYTRARTLAVDSIEAFSPHNTFLLVLVDYGIVGILLLILVFRIFWQMAFSSRKKHPLNIALFITIAVLMNVEIVFLTMHYIFLFYMMAMLAKDNVASKPAIFKRGNRIHLISNGQLINISAANKSE